MAEEKKIIINYQGKEMKPEQLISYHGQQGETVYELQRKNCKLIFNSTGEKNVIAVADQHGKVNWLGTYSTDITLKTVDLVMFKDDYMSRFNCASVLDTTGIRYQIPPFNYFEQELIAEETDENELIVPPMQKIEMPDEIVLPSNTDIPESMKKLMGSVPLSVLLPEENDTNTEDF